MTVCEWCHIAFVQKGAGSQKRRFCSRKCSALWWATQPHPKVERACRRCGQMTLSAGARPICDACRTLTCQTCGKSFIAEGQSFSSHIYKGVRKQRAFCSKLCAGKFNGALVPKGPNSPLWNPESTRHNSGPYTRNSWLALKEATAKVAEHLCQGCGQPLRKKFALHHLDYVSDTWWNDDLTTNDVTALCYTCHLSIHHVARHERLRTLITRLISATR